MIENGAIAAKGFILFSVVRSIWVDLIIVVWVIGSYNN